MSSMYCKITGSSRSLPRPNYFPLMKPISPAEAKKLFCRITAKSWNLPAHNYIPIFPSLQPNTRYCNVTRGNLSMFKCYTPFIPEGNRKFTDSTEKFVYVIDDKFALILPESIEMCIKDGRIDDMMLSKDETDLEIKLNNIRETLKLVECTFDKISLKQGKGPSLKKQRKSVRTRTKIFEDKETVAELEEKKSVEKIEPKIEVVESVTKKIIEEISRPFNRCLSRGLSIDFTELHEMYGDTLDDDEKQAKTKITAEPHADAGITHEKTSEEHIGISSESRKSVLGHSSAIKVPKKVPGQIYKTQSGTKFVPGQFIQTSGGQKFIPGQMEIIDGELRFVPGQVLKIDNFGPTFIPGQLLTINNESKFVAGQVLEINGEGRFVPGSISQENGRIKFIPGEVIETEEGTYSFVCEATNIDGEWQYSFQGLDLDIGAGVNFGVDLQTNDILPQNNGIEKQRLQDSMSRISDLNPIEELEGSETPERTKSPLEKRNTLDLKLILGMDQHLPVYDSPDDRERMVVTPAIGEIIQDSSEDEFWSDEVKVKMRVHESGPPVSEGGENDPRSTPTCCVIIKNDLETIIPKEGASKILSGEARYSVIDESGVRFFEPELKVRAQKLELKSFNDEIEGIIDVQHDVKITEITTPEGEDSSYAAIDEGFRMATTSSTKVEMTSNSDFDFDLPAEQILDSSLAKSKLAIKQVGKRRATSPRSSSNNIPEQIRNETNFVEVKEAREASLAELLDTEEEFIKDIRYLMNNYYHACDQSSDKLVSESRESVFGNLAKIAEFHEGLLLDGLKGNSDSSKMIGRCFLRLERDLDCHAKYIEEEARAEQFLRENPKVNDFFEEISASLNSPKSLVEQLRLPNQRINDYQVILSELVGFERELGVPTSDLEKALELMLTLPQKSADEKFLNSIEGYKGSVKNLGRLIAHDWFSLQDITGKTHERYLFLFKGRILVTKVKRITEDRSVFILKDVLRLPDLDLLQSDKGNCITLYEQSTGGKYTLEHTKLDVKDFWLQEIKNFARDKTPDSRTRRQDSVTVDYAYSSEDESTGLSDKILDQRSRKISVEKSVAEKTIAEESRVEESKIEETSATSVLSEKAASKITNGVTESKAEEATSNFSRQTSLTTEKAELKRTESLAETKVEESNSNIWSRQSSIRSENVEAKVTESETKKAAESKTSAYSRQSSALSEPESVTKGVAKPSQPKPEEEPSAPSSRRSSIVNLRRDSSKMDLEKRPKLATGVKSVQCEPGEKAVLSAAFTSASPCSVTWLRDNKPLDDKLADRVKIINLGNDYRLELLNCREDDTGLYAVRCTNEFGSISSSGILTVHELTAEERALKISENSPYFNVKFRDVDVLEDTVACFMIELKGDPAPKLKIYKDGKILAQDDRVKLESTGIPGHYDLLINHIQPGDAGTYKCTAMNSYGSDEFTAELKVVQEKDVFHGMEEAPLDFTWFRDGRAFTPEERFQVMFKDEEDTLALVFQHVTPEDAGLYTCIASTSSGKISCSAELTVKGAIHQLLKEPLKPCITTKLTPCEFNTGGSAMLEIKADGYPKPTLAWTKDGKEIKANEKYRFLCEDDESTALIIKNVEIADAGEYKVVATNDLGEDESACLVIVKSPPKFTKKMEDFECLVGSDIEMEIKVEGCPEPEIKWYKDGCEIRKDSKHTIVSSGTSHKIIIKSVEKTSSGAYSAIASNSVGQMSCFWTTTVNTAAKFTSKLESVEKEVGEEVTFTVETEGEATEVKWTINEQTVDTKKYKITSKDNKHTLTMSKLARSDSATIKCVASNKYGSDTSSADLQIKRKPEITQKLKPVVVNLGDTAEYSIKVDAYPEPKLKWFLDGVVIDGKKYGKDGDQYKLKLPKVEASGTVNVKVENDYGYDEDSAELTVKCKPSFTQGLKDISVLENENVDIKIVLKGTPTPSLKMFHNGNEVSADARVKITKESTETYHMTFNVILPSDGGDWMLKAENECGEVESRCKITVEGKPIFEKKLSSTIEVVESENVELSVTLRGCPEPVIKWVLNDEELQISKHIEITTNGNTTNETFESKLVIKNVTMEECGEIKVVAENKHGSCETKGLLNVISLAELKTPKVVAELNNATFTKGDSNVLKAVIKGNPAPTAQWFKNGESLGPGTVSGEEYSLKLNDINESNAGEYKIVAKNEHGEISSIAKVDVIFKPEVTAFKDVTVSPGDECVLEAKVRANPEVSKVEFSKDGAVIKDGASYKDGVATLNLGPAEKGTEGVYKLKLINAVGETEAKSKVAVKTDPPVFIKGLTNQELKDGEELLLKVKVSGTPKPKLAWTKDGEEISHEIQEEDGTYTISYDKAGVPETGKYKIVATNSGGTATTEGTVKLLQMKPKFLKSLPRRTSLSELEDLVLKVKVDGSPLPSVAWLKDGVKLEPSDRIKIEQLPDGTCILTIKEATPLDKGSYSISIMNPNGEASSSTNVDVVGKHRKPEFLENLSAPSSVAFGAPIKLTAKIGGYPTPEYKFMKDGKVVRPSAGVLSELKPDGTLTLEILSAKPSDAGKYSLCLSNDKGELSQEVEVAVEEPLTKPKFTKGIADTTVVEGFPLQLEAVLSSNPPPQLSLLKDGVPTPLEVKILPGQGMLKASICIPDAGILNAGIYELVAENSEGQTKSQATISVLPKSSGGEEAEPSFLSDLKNARVDEGEELKLVAQVSGNPLPEIEWKKDGVSLGAGQFDGKHAILKIPAATMQHAGVYECNLNNKLGKASSECEVAVKKIFEAPKFNNRFVDTQQIPTRDCKFGARISGIPTPTIAWTKDGNEIQPSDKYGIKKEGDVVSLVVRNCVDGDKGRYACIITNPEGTDKCEADLDVVKEIERKPRNEAPYFLKKISSTELYDGMSAKFTACVEGFPEPEFEWFKDGVKLEPTDRIKFEREGAGLLRLIIKKVTEDDVGKYKLRIFNSVGEAQCEANLKFESLETRKKSMIEPDGDYDKHKKSGLPVPLADKPIISCMSDRNLTLSWRPSLSSVARYPVTYTVEMCEVKDGGDDWFEVRRGLRQCVCDIRNLDPRLDYKFRIRVENKLGISDPSPYAITLRSKFDLSLKPWTPTMTHPIPRDYDLERPPHEGYTHPPRFLNQPHDTQYGVKGMNSKLLWFVYGYPKPTIRFEFNGVDITKDIGGGAWATTYRNNGEVALFINRMTENLVGSYRAIATNPLGEAIQDVRLELAEEPRFILRPKETYIMLRKGGKITAKVTGIPVPEIKIYKDWKPIGESSRLKFNISESLECVTITIELRDSILKDAGLYSITATNLASSTHTSFNIHIEESEPDYNWLAYVPPRPIKPRFKGFYEYYDLGDEIGRGTQGITYHAVDRNSGHSYACKYMRGTGIRRDWIDNEINIMDGLSHPHITRLVEWFGEPSGVRVVMEMSSGGDIIQSLLSRRDVEEWEIAYYVRQMLLGLDYLHERNIGHLGLTPFDILMSRSGGRDLRITDFGLARRIGSKLLPLDYGMPEFVAPEIALGYGVGLSADIWSVGVITYLLLSGRSLFRGRNDMETLDNIKAGSWTFDDCFSSYSMEARDFLTKLLVFEHNGRLDIKSCLSHPWFSIRHTGGVDVTRLTTNYYDSLRSWYSNASCRDIYRRRPLSGAYTHPSKMVYPPGDYTPHERSPTREPRDYIAPEAVYPRPNLDTEIGAVSSESHYQTGPDTYLLQLRDADFPARLRQYMKVAAYRSPAMALQLKGAAYDTDRTVIYERRRFTDVMDEEIGDECKNRITNYGEKNPASRRLKHEVGQRMDIQAEAEALVLSKRDGSVPVFRIKPDPVIEVVIGMELVVSVVVDGDPLPGIQWFKNDLVINETNRIKTLEDKNTFSLSFSKIVAFDVGVYKVVARSPNGQTAARFRINEVDFLEDKRSRVIPELDYQVESNPIPVTSYEDVGTSNEIYRGKFSVILNARSNIVRYSKGYSDETELVSRMKHIQLANVLKIFKKGDINVFVQEAGGDSLLNVLSESDYSEQTLFVITAQILDALSYIHWRGCVVLNIEPGNILLNNVNHPVAKIADFSSLQPVSRLGSAVKVFTPTEFTPPELLNSELALHTTDIWNIGILLYVLLSGHSPFLGENEDETKSNVNYVRFRFEYLFNDLTQEITRFIMLVFKRSPLKRPSIEECFENRWFLPSEFMIKKREKSVFKGRQLKQYVIDYVEKRKSWGKDVFGGGEQLTNGD